MERKSKHYEACLRTLGEEASASLLIRIGRVLSDLQEQDPVSLCKSEIHTRLVSIEQYVLRVSVLSRCMQGVKTFSNHKGMKGAHKSSVEVWS